MASNQDYKILISKIDSQRGSDALKSDSKEYNRSKTKSDRSVGFFPADNIDSN